MKCRICEKTYDIQDFMSFRVYDNDFLVKSFDICDYCIDELTKKDKIDECKDKAFEKGYEFYEVSRCAIYDDCNKIDNLRIKCEKEKKVGESQISETSLLKTFTKPVTWCDPANAGIIRATVRLYELFDNYDKTSTKINKNMLEYTKNMRNLTWWILGFTAISAVLTFVNLWIALS